MKRLQFIITIWHWKTVLHRAVYEFYSTKEATNYELGLFEGLRIAGKKPTGCSCKPLKNKE